MSTQQQDVSPDVGKEVLYENERFKVWGMTLEPGESSSYHRHVYDYAFFYTTPSRIAVRQHGQPDIVQEYGREFVQYSVVGEGIEHQITNAGDETHHQIILEFKGPSAFAEPLPPETNGRVKGPI